jgi:CRISPR type II-A-associated protein Csn2
LQIGVEYDGGKFSRSGDKEQQTSRRSGTDVGNYRKTICEDGNGSRKRQSFHNRFRRKGGDIMKVTCLEPPVIIEILQGKTASLVIESPETLEQFLMNLRTSMNKSTQYFSLSDEMSEMDLSKACELVTTPFDLTYDRREIKKRLYDELCDFIIHNDFSERLSEIHGLALSLLDDLKIVADYETEYEEELTFTDFLKKYDVRLKDPEGKFGEKLIEYMTTMYTLQNISVFFIANCDAYLSTSDYEYIEKTAEYYDIYVIYVRNKQIFLKEDKNEYIIDMDMCEIH